MLSLRPYQREALDSIYDYFESSSGNPVVSIPTGGGKSLIIARLLKESFEWWPDTRVLILTHAKELIVQNFHELIGLWPEAPAGLHSAGLNHRDTTSPIIFGGIQSLHKCAHDLPRIDLVIIDEAHLVPRTATTMYRKFLTALSKLNPYMKIVGLTATPFRLDSGLLYEGSDALFTDLCCEANVKDLIDGGFLCHPVSELCNAQIDTQNVNTRGGEFIPSQLEAAALDPRTIGRVVDEIVGAGSSRRGWLIFACGIKHADMLCKAINNHGYNCETVFGDTPTAERRQKLDDFKKGKFRALSTVGILTTGFNAKHVDLLAIVRPTKSPGLWCQMVGRGLRLSPETGKQDCLVLDFGGNIARHGPIDNPIIHKPQHKQEETKSPEKICPRCGMPNALRYQVCAACLYVFPTSERLVETKPSKLSVISSNKPEWIKVECVRYRRHRKSGKPDSLCVSYGNGLNSYREWICLEHTGFARQKAIAWWQSRAREIPVPNTITEALELQEHIEVPLHIAVRRIGKYFEIVGASF